MRIHERRKSEETGRKKEGKGKGRSAPQEGGGGRVCDGGGEFFFLDIVRVRLES